MLSRIFNLNSGIIILSLIVPSSGYILLNRHVRGMIMLIWMMVMGFITYQLTDEGISFIGRYSGGFAVWIISVIECHHLILHKNKIA